MDVKVSRIGGTRQRDKDGHMRIGELSERTGTPRRLLRYYEEQKLILPDRCANGYRSYDERLVDRVLQIRGLLDAGLPTRIIKRILPFSTSPGAFTSPTPHRR
ncbi:hypothetical protein SANTM175S_00300 [Streptomyces antimycoticus]